MGHNMAPVPSIRRIVVFSFLVSFSVLLVSSALQWLIYDDWLHETGPVRFVLATLASVVTFAFVLQRFRVQRERHVQAQRRFQIIAEMNDRIRNKVQALACLRYASDERLGAEIRDAVDAIDAALNGVIADAGESLNKASRDSEVVGRAKSA